MSQEDRQCKYKSRLRLKRDDTRAETGFRLSAKGTNPFKSAGASVQSTTGSRVVRISGANAGYTMFRGCVKGTGYPLHSPVSPSLHDVAGRWPATSWVHYTTSCNTQSSAPENGKIIARNMLS